MLDHLTVNRPAGAATLSERIPVARHAPPPIGLREASGHPNPTLRLDPGLGMVVVAFHDEHGAITSTIPTQQQLDAYRTWERTRSGPRPGGSEV